MIHSDACCTALVNQVLLKGSTGMEITGCKIQTAGMVVNKQHPNYSTLTVMVHLAMWHAIHFCICRVLYKQLTGTRSETWQCEASCSSWLQTLHIDFYTGTPSLVLWSKLNTWRSDVYRPQHTCNIHTEVKIKLLAAEFLLLSFSELHWTMHFICTKQ